MDIVQTALDGLMAAPGVKEALTGTTIKLVVEFLKKFFLKVDNGTEIDQYKVPLQLVTIICTFIATLASLASNHQLATLDVNSVINFVNVALPTYLCALGIAPAFNSAKSEIAKQTDKLKK